MLDDEKTIFAAIRSRDLPMLRRCLGRADELESVNEYGRTPLLQAALLGYADVVLEILPKGRSWKQLTRKVIQL